MKIRKKAIFASAFLSLIIAACALLAGRGGEYHASDVSSKRYLATGDSVTIMDNGKSDFDTILLGTVTHVNPSQEALALENFFYPYSKDIIFEKAASSSPTTNVITYGRVAKVPLSVRLADDVDSRPSDSYVWGIAYENGVLALCANSRYALNAPVSRTLSGHDLFPDLYLVLNSLISDGKVTVTEGQYEVFELTAEEYAALVAEDDAQYERETEERKALRVEFIKNELASLKAEDFGTPETGYTLTTDFGKASSGSPDYYPKADSHPRVLFTKDDIPAIREKLESLDQYSDLYRKVSEYLKNEELDGILGEPRKQARGYHNYDWEMLYAIQFYALTYAVYGDEYYGYVAIYAMENFLLTLHVDYIYSDQCREFGYAMYIAACVYDWCYDLLTESDKVNIAMGVEHRLCRGEVPNTMNGILSTSYPVKMEMGFPPTRQSAVGGHGSEFQLLRDYLAMSIAVFDELPGWYELVGGRFYNEFAVVRRDYYAAGIYPQGMSYGPYRFLPDTYAAVLIESATGYSAYGSEIADVIYTFLANETVSGGMFSTGDCGPTSLPANSIGSEALILSYVLSGSDDSTLLFQIAKSFMTDKDYIEASLESVSVAEFFVFSSASAASEKEYRTELPLIWYNGGYMGQYIVRNSWDGDAAVVMMRIGELTTGNHEHKDAGTFQIFYKGLLSGSSGGSGTYGSLHWSYYYQATVSDNGLLVFDPTMATTEADIKKDSNGNPIIDSFGNVSYNNSEKLFYTGSQTRPSSDPGSYAEWQSGRYDRATILGFAEGYSQSGDAKFAYVASDITKSYLSTQANYVGRSMLTVYTDDEDYPMIFFVFDNIDAARDDIVKKFLLQINGENAPKIDESTKTVVVEENGGQLVLQNVLGAEKIESIGGGYGSNFMINGTNCVDKSIDSTHASQQSWGRVELSSTGADSSDYMLNVIYVSDSGNQNRLSAVGVKGYDKMTMENVLLEGATIGNVTALFSTEYDRIADEITVTANGEGMMTYYVGGLHEGTWLVSFGGEYVGTLYPTHNSGLVSFKAPAGTEITLTPGSDIRPSGSEKLSFVTSGGTIIGDVPGFYFPGTSMELPTDVVRGSDYFNGWYLDREFTQPISVIPEDASGTVVLYAKWNSVFINEDYSNTKIELVDKTSGSAYQNGIGYLITDEMQTTYKTDGTDGEKYLFWQTSGGGPTVYLDGSTSTIATMSDEKITYIFTFADAGEEKDMSVAVRVRNASTPKQTVSFFNISGGKILFNDTKIATLREDSFTTVTVVLDFELGEIRAKTSESDEIFVMSTALPERSTFAKEIFAMRSSGAGAIKIGSIKIVGGDVLGGSSGGASDYFDFPKEAIFPAGTDKTYIPNESTPIPKDGVSAVIDGVKYELVGWYLDESLATPITTVPDGVSGKFTVYAKWRTVIAKEDFSETELNEVDKTAIYQDKGGIIYLETGGKTTTFKTENESLLWKSNGAGSSVYMDAKTLSIATMSEDQITYTLSLAKSSDEFMNLEVRVRNVADPKVTVSLFNVVGGKIVFDGKEIAELTEDYITVKVVVDFAKGEIRACTSASDEGYARIVSLPERESFSRELFAIRASSAGSVRIGLIKLVEGDALDVEVASPTEKDYIAFPSEAILPGGTDPSYKPNEGTLLPTDGVFANIDGKRHELVGWYLDESLTNPITAVPDGVSGKFTVYAKWRDIILFEDYSSTTLNHVDVTALYYKDSVSGIQYYQTDGKKTTFKTEEGEIGRCLLWKQSEGSGSQILVENEAIAKMSGNAISYVFSFADAGEETDMNVVVSVRNKAKDCEAKLFEISGGKIKFGSREIASISEDAFTTVSLVLDFENSEIRLSVSGKDEIYTESVALDLRENFTREIFRMRAGNSGSIRIGEIKAYAGDILADRGV